MTVRELGKFVICKVVLYQVYSDSLDTVNLNKECEIDELPEELLNFDILYIYPRSKTCLDIKVAEPELPFSEEVPV